MASSTTLHQALQAAINAPGAVTKSQLAALLVKHPAPELPDENDLVIRDGILHVDVKECNCVASSWNAPEGCIHEHHCGLHPVIDISTALERGGYRA
ncbi:hypothetical protein [Arthrobacter methylotrophus]|uniref:SWIM-type domain-containing protein n=1 Tax=Arthrobacter methylotrophus TaxID=121291 RepID=A0ABV5UNF0_9MICC